MSSYYLGQIGIYGFNFAPRGWAVCAGSIISIAQNTALYSLLGTYYGGNGQTTFGLPDLRSRTPLGMDGNYPIGELSGTENVTITSTSMPQHNHPAVALSTAANALKSDGHIFAGGVIGPAPFTPHAAYTLFNNLVTLNLGSVATQGGSQPHSNLQPYLTVNYCIATTGIYPSRN